MAAISAHAVIFRPSPSIYRPLFSSSSSSSHSLPSSSSNTSGRLSFSTRETKRSSVIAMGSSSSSLSGFDDRIGEILADVSIFTASTGESIMFKDLWDQKEGMAVVALLRHFGCPCCWELASTLKESKERFDSAGVKLVAVGVGTPDKARILAERTVKELVLDLENRGSISEDHELPFPLDSLYADPDRKAYDVLGLYYGLGRTFFNPASAKVFTRFGSLQKAVKNYTISATPDDRSSVLQQGGMFVFKGNKLLYARKDEGTGDHAPLSEILDLCCTASAV